jgi:hypothetical protein
MSFVQIIVLLAIVWGAGTLAALALFSVNRRSPEDEWSDEELQAERRLRLPLQV